MSSETYQQWHDGFSGAAELERLRTENEQLREQVHARSDQEAIDMAVSRAVLAERELASLRTENERLKLELEISWDDLPGAIDALDDVIPQGCKQLLRQCAKDLRALRRPLEQSADVESIRATIAELKQYWAANPGDVPYNLTRYFEHGDLLLAALDTTARQLRERVEMLEAAKLENEGL